MALQIAAICKNQFNTHTFHGGLPFLCVYQLRRLSVPKKQPYNNFTTPTVFLRERSDLPALEIYLWFFMAFTEAGNPAPQIAPIVQVSHTQSIFAPNNSISLLGSQQVLQVYGVQPRPAEAPQPDSPYTSLSWCQAPKPGTVFDSVFSFTAHVILCGKS